MSWTISQLTQEQGYASVVYDSDVLIINNLGVTKGVTIKQLKLAFQGTAFVLDATAPNNTIPVFAALASQASGASGYTNIDIVIRPKGNGSILGQVPDNATAGGNKRGSYSVDFQLIRSSSTAVNAGSYSFLGSGQNNGLTSAVSYGFIGTGLTNTMTGAQGFIGTGNSNSVAGTNNFIGNGQSNALNGNTHYSTIVNGQSNTINPTQPGNTHHFIGGGFSNTINPTLSGILYSTIGGGTFNSLTGFASMILGGQYGTDRGDYNAFALAAGRFATLGDAQRREFVGRLTTTDATVSTVYLDGGTTYTPGNRNLPTLPTNSAYKFTADVVARSNATGNCAAYEITGVIRQGASAATTAVLGVTTTVIYEDVVGWDATAIADTTNGALAIRVTGAAGTTIKWVVNIRTVEVVG